MKIQRVSNAGVLLELDGVRILLDGFCSGVGGYEAIPEALRAWLFENPPDLLAFTHRHADHFDASMAAEFQKKSFRPILGPEDLPVCCKQEPVTVGSVKVTPVPSRHLGKVPRDLGHVSYVIEGSSCVWFLGDAAPSQWKSRGDLPRPDCMIVPYAYGLTESAWRETCSLTDRVVLVHLPRREEDPCGLWQQVKKVTAKANIFLLHMPEIGGIISL